MIVCLYFRGKGVERPCSHIIDVGGHRLRLGEFYSVVCLVSEGARERGKNFCREMELFTDFLAEILSFSGLSGVADDDPVVCSKSNNLMDSFEVRLIETGEP